MSGREPATLDTQLARFDAHSLDALRTVMHTFWLDAATILLLARDRLEAGVEDFGDQGWHQPPDALAREIREELADAVVYEAFRLWQHETKGAPDVDARDSAG
jgi:hypothetical protein